jgi:hypothetical protein
MTSMICPIERQLNAREARRLKAEDRYLARMEKREAIAEKMIGTLCRDGQEVYYVFPQGGRYREGSWYELISFLIRNKYA